MSRPIHSLLAALLFLLPLVVRAEDPITTPAQVPTGKLVCVGDSITAGSLATRPEYCYVSLLQKLAALSHSDLRVVNAGLSGFSTGAYAYRPDEKAEHIPLDTTLITIMLGTNDTREKKAPEAIGRDAASNLRRLIQAYQKRVPHAKIVLVTPPQLYPGKFTQDLRRAGYDETGPTKLRAIDAACHALAKELRLQFVDVSNLPAAEQTPEGVHPNDMGHAALAEAIWGALSGQTGHHTQSKEQ